jgi:thioredoxin 1
MSKLIQITQENINEILNESEKIVILDFYSPGCGPCESLQPILEDLADDYANQAIFAKINANEFMDFTVEHLIRTVPHVLIFKNGELIDRIPNKQDKEVYKKHLDALI